ncbi:MAG: rod shape-determining protein MreC [Rickettsiales bacterium]|nr:MAG: rod shape-determining protein MreC [Rickettsiales bacterium]
MAILINRVKIRNNLLELGKFTLFSIRRFLVGTLIVVSCYLLYFSPVNIVTTSLLEVVGKTLSAGVLIYNGSIDSVKLAYGRLSYFKDLESENLRLKLELTELKKIKQLALDARVENQALRQMLRVPPKLRNNFVTAKIVGVSSTPFASSAVIQAGEADGVRVNDVVKGKSGLIGRITEISKNYSTVVLIDDHNSRIPLITSNSKARGLLAKQGDRLKMIHLKEDHTATIGEMIYTSGDGKIYPKGIAVAKIERVTHEGVFVKLVEHFDDMEFVIIESTL